MEQVKIPVSVTCPVYCRAGVSPIFGTAVVIAPCNVDSTVKLRRHEDKKSERANKIGLALHECTFKAFALAE